MGDNHKTKQAETDPDQKAANQSTYHPKDGGSISHKMTAIFTAFYVIGAAFMGVGGVVGFSSDHTGRALWLLLGGFFLILVGVALHIRAASQAENSGSDYSSPIPKLPKEKIAANADPQPTFQEHVREVTFTFGTNGVTYKMTKDLSPRPLPIVFGGIKSPILYVVDRKPYIDVEIYGGHGESVVTVKRNQFIKPHNWDSNSNDTALEIVDENQQPVLQLYYRTPSHIVINGVFLGQSGQILTATDDATYIETVGGERRQIKRIFKYPAWKYRGQFDESP